MPERKTTKAEFLALLEKHFGPDATFTLSEVYAVTTEAMQARRPNNNTIQHNIRSQLWHLKQDGLITYVDGNGTYRWNTPANAAPAPLSGTVYILRNKVGSTGGYKIGISKDIKARLKQLEVGKKCSVIGLWKSDNYSDLERILHVRYKDCRIPQSEWFALSKKELQDAIQWLEENAECQELNYTIKKPSGPSPWQQVAIGALVSALICNFLYLALVSYRVGIVERALPPAALYN